MASSGWMGSLKTVLRQAETSHQPRPEGDENVVAIPQGLEKLAKAIRSLQSELVEAQTERSTYDDAWKLCQQEISTAYEKNAARQKSAAHRLSRLQQEWRNVTQDLGLRCEIVQQPIDSHIPFPVANDLDESAE